MSFAQENGYTPRTFEALMDLVRQGVNTQFGTTYTTDTFVGTNWYKYAYQIIQKIQENEAKTGEIFQKLQQYIALTNEQIQRPSVSLPGLLESFASEDYIASVRPATAAKRGLVAICVDLPASLTGVRASGTVYITDYAALVDGAADQVSVGASVFVAQSGAVTPGDLTFRAVTSDAVTAASLAAQINSHATASTIVRARAVGDQCVIEAVLPGTAGNAITLSYSDSNPSSDGADVSAATLLGGTAAAAGYAAEKLAVATLIKDFIEAGLVTEGAQSQAIVLSNGQSFDFKFSLPNRYPILLRVSATVSENTTITIPSDEDIRAEVFEQVNARYRLGWNFEPQKYYNVSDAPWASDLILEYSFDDGGTWTAVVYDALFDEILTFALEDIEVVI